MLQFESSSTYTEKDIMQQPPGTASVCFLPDRLLRNTIMGVAIALTLAACNDESARRQ
ncbi:MAG: hypothetical protein QNK31_05680 [Porticoccus sp.]|nr:hypothetical protein [Porticoccus sp.]